MSLMTCPECGKENISSTAESCPYCGFLVKEYFENIEQKRLKNEKLKDEIEKLKPELEENLKKIDDLQYPPKPKLSLFQDTTKSITFILLGICSLVFCGAGIVTGIVLNEFFGMVALFVIGIFFAYLCYLGFKDVYDDYLHMIKEYESQISDWEGYKTRCKEEIEKRYSEYAANMVEYGNRYGRIISKSLLECPHCGSINIKKITNINRTTSVLTWGIASSKIGKQYECKSCKHKW